ncbi:MAG: signal peptidase I [Nocardioidaceae bacterium]|nr:signal peptidase I [Nocardioidaceae bacterium]
MTTEQRRAPTDASRVRLRSVLLNVGALLGVLCIVAGLASVLLDVRPLVFRSGSMSPEIRTGAVALARDTDAPDLRVGDVVSVTNAEGARITHRIVSLQGSGDTRLLRLRGDDNRTPDEETYPVVRVPRVFAHLNGAGFAVSWLSTPPAVFLGGLLSGVLLVLVFGGHRASTPPGRRRDDPGDSAARSRAAGHATTGLAVLLVLGAVTGAVVARPTTTLAAWSSNASATSGSFSTLTVLPVDAVSCTNGSGRVVIGWKHKSLDYDYALTITRVSDPSMVSTGSLPGTGAVGSDLQFPITTGLLTGTLVGTIEYDVAVRSRLKGSPNWVSTPKVYRIRTVSVVVTTIECRAVVT